MSVVVFLLLFVLVGGVEGGEGGGHWGYREGNGPESWQKVCQDGFRQTTAHVTFLRYKLLKNTTDLERSGTLNNSDVVSWNITPSHAAYKSPIDIRASDIDYALLHRMHFVHYDHSGAVNVTNNGHTVAVSGFDKWGPRQPFIQGGGLKHRYNLQQFHFHWAQHDHQGSEHKIGGLHYPAELHLVHVRQGISLQEAIRRPDGIAVVGVFLIIGHDGGPMASVSSVLESVIFTGNQSTVQGFRARPLLPARTEAFYRYEGSLTTPTCDEAVIWTVLAEPITITRSQFLLFTLFTIIIEMRPNVNNRKTMSSHKMIFLDTQ
ncbi:carbonate dehydratase, eukaryotic-type [Teladorsagia circumcincta]|uniref:Carbonic anhydrase n=1 Tax=Teladorsagia circumcincta TaxID=45464 RepID=A0A2G9UMS2_TELCI|nr:carbonate dehydratase, eukaryotic-type [Teladorsagia circumcincta]